MFDWLSDNQEQSLAATMKENGPTRVNLPAYRANDAST